MRVSGGAAYSQYPRLFAALCVAAFGLGTSLVASRARRVTGETRPPWIVAAVVIAIAATYLIPARVRTALPAFGRSFVATFLEFRAFDAGVVTPAMSRTSDGGVVCIRALKKSVLRSLP